MDKVGGFFAIEGSSSVDCAQIIESVSTKLRKNGYSVETIIFPEPDTSASFFANNYLKGKYDNRKDSRPYSSSIFYALERYEASAKIRNLVSSGHIVLVNRYSSFTMAKFGAGFSNPEERRGYYAWLDNLDFVLLDNPRPDNTFILDASSQQQGDTQPKQPTKLQLGPESMKILAELSNYYPRDFTHIDCVRSAKQINNQQIVSILWDKLSTVLPSNKTIRASQPKVNNFVEATDTNYYIPASLNPETKALYTKEIDSILAKYRELNDSLKKYTDINQKFTDKQLSAITQLVLPVAIGRGGQKNPVSDVQPKTKLQTLIDANLPSQYGQMEQSLRLINVTPRNELDLVPELLYGHSHLSLDEIKEQVAKWNYQQKADVFTTSIKQSQQEISSIGPVCDRLLYSWDILSSYSAFIGISASAKPKVNLQPLTPRYGYAVPELIVDAGLEELFQDCFDISLMLHSKLVAAGYEYEAQYASLHGHRMRWQADVNLESIAYLLRIQIKDIADPEYAKLVADIQAQIGEHHPLLVDALLTFPSNRGKM